MLGTQIGFNYNGKSNFNSIHNPLFERLSVSEDQYSYGEEDIICSYI